MSKRVLKWDVPVDDHDHPIGSGRVVHVACQGTPYVVQVWTEEPVPGDRASGTRTEPRRVRVYGTGQEIPDYDEHLGSVVTYVNGTPLVWHCFGAPL